jgi:hypothetical protein
MVDQGWKVARQSKGRAASPLPQAIGMTFAAGGAMNTNADDVPGSGEKREASEGRENRGGQAGQGKHTSRNDAPDQGANQGGGQQQADKKSRGVDRPKQATTDEKRGNG